MYLLYNINMIYAISDLHLSLDGNKPMEIFGDGWKNYLQSVERSWLDLVGPEDTVLLAGDLSWAMRLENAKADFEFLSRMPGEKVIIRGNHDYWWSSYNKVQLAVPQSVHPLQNNAYRLPHEGVVVCGSRGWTIADDKSTDEDKKIYLRELLRMEMALKDAKAKMEDGDRLYVMIHYPPFGNFFEKTEMTALFDTYGVAKVIYGHIHSKTSFHKKVVRISETDYYLTSTDMVDHQLVAIE